MAKKEPNKIKTAHTKQVAKELPLKDKDNFWLKNNRYNLYGLISVISTLLVYFNAFFNDFVLNWDDGGYVVVNDVIHKINFQNLSIIFSTFDKGNYHPLTTLMYAIEYWLVGDNPFLYHFNNIIIHLANVYLVFLFIFKISRKTEVAFITAVFFGIHPMHVESVAWISERKDVMYTLFFLLSLLAYYRYIYSKVPELKYFLFSLLFFLMALLSKSAAVILPIVLVLLDLYLKRNVNLRFVLDKIPFFMLSLLFGILAILSQDSAGAIQDLDPMFTIPERLMLASYGLTAYIIKLFVPFNLMAMYPYPERIGTHLPTLFYIAPFFVVSMALIIFIFRKKFRFVLFGMLFFVITIVLVLQLLPVGGALMAERYTYVPYIGLFFIIGHFYLNARDNANPVIKKAAPAFKLLIIAFGIMCAFLTFQRNMIWKNGEVLFTDVIAKNPRLPFAYNNRGYLYYRFIKNYDKAIADFNKCIEIDSTFDKCYGNKAVLLYNTDRREEALVNFDKCLKLKPNNTDALIGRANTLSHFKEFEKSLPDYNYYIKLKPDDEKAYLWRAIAYYNVKKLDSAMYDIKTSLGFDPQNAEAIFWSGLVKYETKDYKSAIEDLNTALRLNPDKNEIYTWRGLAYYNLKDYEKAIADYSKAIEINPKNAPAYVNRSIAYHESGRNKEAFEDINKAVQLGYPLDKNYFMKLYNLVLKK